MARNVTVVSRCSASDRAGLRPRACRLHRLLERAWRPSPRAALLPPRSRLLFLLIAHAVAADGFGHPAPLLKDLGQERERELLKLAAVLPPSPRPGLGLALASTALMVCSAPRPVVALSTFAQVSRADLRAAEGRQRLRLQLVQDLVGSRLQVQPLKKPAPMTFCWKSSARRCSGTSCSKRPASDGLLEEARPVEEAQRVEQELTGLPLEQVGREHPSPKRPDAAKKSMKAFFSKACRKDFLLKGVRSISTRLGTLPGDTPRRHFPEQTPKTLPATQPGDTPRGHSRRHTPETHPGDTPGTTPRDTAGDAPGETPRAHPETRGVRD